LTSPDHAALLKEASLPYRRAGLFAYFFARSKLRRDPVYRALLERGLLLGRSRILDLGCGQALLIAWLRAAARVFDHGRWPPAWPAVPRPASTRGIELMARDVNRAHVALGTDVDVIVGDIRDVDFGIADAVVVLDVLHYMTSDAQHDVLQRVRRALPPTGLLLLRVGDAGAGPRYRLTQWVDKVVMRLRGHAVVALHCRNISEWQAVLKECGFDSEAQPMSQGTPFANVLLIAHPSPDGGHPVAALLRKDRPISGQADKSRGS
jgi:SAM-dependent methyltransferase